MAQVVGTCSDCGLPGKEIVMQVGEASKLCQACVNRLTQETGNFNLGKSKPPKRKQWPE